MTRDTQPCPKCGGTGMVECDECEPTGPLASLMTVIHDCEACAGTGQEMTMPLTEVGDAS